MNDSDFKEGQTVWWFYYAYSTDDFEPAHLDGLALRHGIYKNNHVKNDDDCYKADGINEFFHSKDEALMALFQQVNKSEDDE